MKPFIFYGVFAGLILAGGSLWAQSSQSMPGLQTSFPVQGQGLRVFPTPQDNAPITPYTPLRPVHPKPTPVKGKFYHLQPLPKGTSSLSRKGSPKTPQRPVTVLAPRGLRYHSPYQDPARTGSR